MLANFCSPRSLLTCLRSVIFKEGSKTPYLQVAFISLPTTLKDESAAGRK